VRSYEPCRYSLRRQTQETRSGTFPQVIAAPILVPAAGSVLLVIAGPVFLFAMASRTMRLKVHLYPHLFRHACATRSHELEADLGDPGLLGGHESVDTMPIDIRVSPSRQRRAIRELEWGSST